MIDKFKGLSSLPIVIGLTALGAFSAVAAMVTGLAWLAVGAAVPLILLGLASIAAARQAEDRAKRLEKAAAWARAQGVKVEADDLETALVRYHSGQTAEREVLDQKAREAAEEVRDKDALLNALSARHLVASFDLQGQLIEANEAFRRALGYGEDELAHAPHQSFCHEDYARTEAYQAFWTRLVGGEPDSGKYKRFAKTGAHVWLQGSYTPVKGQSGEAEAILFLGTDITRAEDNARRANERAAAAESASAPMVVLSRDGMIGFVNAAAEAFVRGHEEAVARRWPGLTQPDLMRPLQIVGEDMDAQIALFSNEEAMPYRTEIDLDGVTLALSVAMVKDADGYYAGNVIELNDVTEERRREGVLTAWDRCQALAEFAPDGTILSANEKFLSAVGYERSEVIGQHHGIFVPKDQRSTSSSSEFWKALARGEPHAGLFEWVGRGDKPLWLRASYIPVTDGTGRVTKVVKAVHDVTEEMLAAGDQRALMDAVKRTQAVIEFDLEGHVLSTNAGFCEIMGYKEDEVRGRHHRMFVEADEAAGEDYARFWQHLAEGHSEAGKFTRVRADGSRVVLHAVYTLVRDSRGKPFKIVELATDITAHEKMATEASYKSSAFENASVAMMMVDREMRIQHINRSTVELFKENEDVFRTVWPNFDPERMIGRCVDDFHENPARIRAVLNDPARLPFRTGISIGDLRIDLAIGAVYDRDGAFVGCTLEWTDVTEARTHAGMVDALDRSQALIEFGLDGTIQKANQNFLDIMGYEADDIVGRHHSMFVTSDVAAGEDYASLWEELRAGKARTARVKRLGKGGREVYIQATYTPIFDQTGQPFKVVKVASDVTESEKRRQAEAKIEAERMTAQREAVDALAEGLKRLSNGNFGVHLKDGFTADYIQIRDDFNEAVRKLQEADKLRVRVEADQKKVVDRLANALRELAAGVLDSQIKETFPGEYDQLRRDFNTTVERLGEVMHAITSAARSITTGAGEISIAADDLSKRTENQAATLEETAAALDQITATVRQTAESAKEVNL
ncbi:MAG: PAS domain S-box protein, partial [Parvularcula sp.]|nr:PAS domain S-box protein [Parvularcula sp.]